MSTLYNSSQSGQTSQRSLKNYSIQKVSQKGSNSVSLTFQTVQTLLKLVIISSMHYLTVTISISSIRWSSISS